MTDFGTKVRLDHIIELLEKIEKNTRSEEVEGPKKDIKGFQNEPKSDL